MYTTHIEENLRVLGLTESVHYQFCNNFGLNFLLAKYVGVSLSILALFFLTSSKTSSV